MVLFSTVCKELRCCICSFYSLNIPQYMYTGVYSQCHYVMLCTLVYTASVIMLCYVHWCTQVVSLCHIMYTGVHSQCHYVTLCTLVYTASGIMLRYVHWCTQLVLLLCQIMYTGVHSQQYDYVRRFLYKHRVPTTTMGVCYSPHYWQSTHCQYIGMVTCIIQR